MPITHRKVKSGETLWGIAEELGIPAAQRTAALWETWGYKKDPKKLPIGFTLNISAPDVTLPPKEAVIPNYQ